MFKIILACVLLTISAGASYELYDRRQGSIELAWDPLERAQTLMANREYRQAQIVADFLVENPRLATRRTDLNEAREISRRAQEELIAASTLIGTAKRFLKGAITGEPNDLAELAGSASLDFIVIGDVRDLVVQGYREIRHDDGDKIILALSTVGIATTLAPQIDWAPSVMKAFRRMKKFPDSLLKSLARISRRALSGKTDELVDFASDFGVAARKLELGPFSKALQSVDNPGALRKLARASEADPAKTYIVATGAGSRGLRTVLDNGQNIGTVARKLRRYGRFGKLLRKGTGIVSTPVLTVIAAGCALFAIWLLFRRFISLGFTSSRRL